MDQETEPTPEIPQTDAQPEELPQSNDPNSSPDISDEDELTAMDVFQSVLSSNSFLGFVLKPGSSLHPALLMALVLVFVGLFLLLFFLYVNFGDLINKTHLISMGGIAVLLLIVTVILAMSLKSDPKYQESLHDLEENARERAKKRELMRLRQLQENTENIDHGVDDHDKDE